jgi:hypothetical protein
MNGGMGWKCDFSKVKYKKTEDTNKKARRGRAETNGLSNGNITGLSWEWSARH